MEQILLFLPGLLGLDPGTFVLLVGVLVTIANVIAKLIPESATGFAGVVRKVCAFIGVALANRITPNVTSKDISKAVAAGIPDSVVKHAAELLPSAVETGLGTNAFAAAIVDSAAHPVSPAGDTIWDRAARNGE